MASVISKCNCNSEFQDKQYGKGMRVMNGAFAKGNQKNRYRCTICKTLHFVGK